MAVPHLKDHRNFHPRTNNHFHVQHYPDQLWISWYLLQYWPGSSNRIRPHDRIIVHCPRHN